MKMLHKRQVNKIKVSKAKDYKMKQKQKVKLNLKQAARAINISKLM